MILMSCRILQIKVLTGSLLLKWHHWASEKNTTEGLWEIILYVRPTILTESEAVGNDIDSCSALTPGDFLSLNPKTGNPEFNMDDIDPDYLPRVSTVQHLLETWKRG